MRNLYAFGLSLLLGLTGASAQTTSLRQVIILNGGIFGNPAENVRVTAYRPDSDELIEIDGIGSQSVQEAIVDGDDLYVLAQDSLVKYDLITNQRLAAARFPGPSLLTLAVYDDVVLVGNWFSKSSHNLYFYDRQNLALLDSVAEISTKARSILVVGDTAYVSQNRTAADFFSDSAGYLAVVDLPNRAFVRNIEFADTQDDIGKLFLVNDEVVAVNSANSLLRYNPATGTHTRQPLGFNTRVSDYGPPLQQVGTQMFGLVNGRIGRYDLLTGAVLDSAIVDTTLHTFAYDSVGQQFFVTFIDFVAGVSEGYVFDGNGLRTGLLPVGIAPEVVRADYRTITSLAPVAAAPSVRFYPNPATATLWVEAPEGQQFTLYDLTGRRVLASDLRSVRQAISLTHLRAGAYVAEVRHAGGVVRRQIIKQ